MRTKIVKDSAGNELLVGDYVKARKVIGRVSAVNEPRDCITVAWPQIPGGVLQADVFAAGDCTLLLQADGSEPGVADGIGEGVQVGGHGLPPAKNKK